MENYLAKNFRSWNQFKKYVSQLSGNWIYRGQSDASWDIKSSIERTNIFTTHDLYEKAILNEFKRDVNNYIELNNIPNSTVEWLALMQHHGAPTRLIDFSWSPFIASFFAYENINKRNRNVAVWAINEHALRRKLEDHLELKHHDEFEERRKHYSDEYYELSRRRYTYDDFDWIFKNNENSCILPVEPFKKNLRYSLQQSIFIASGNVLESFMQQLEFLDDFSSKMIIKFILPSSLTKEILRDLQKMNISRTTLFPSLDGYSEGLKMKFNLNISPDEHVKLFKVTNDDGILI